MAPIGSGLIEIQRMYEESTGKTTEETLKQNPRSLILFRLGLGFSLVEFGKRFGFSYVTISQIERGKTKKINKELFSKLIQDIKELPSLEKIIENYKKISQLSRGGQSQALKRAEMAELTEEEKKVLATLTEQGINPEVHKTVMTRICPMNVDLSFMKGNTTFILEATRSQRRQKIESMDFRAIKIKESLKNIKMVAIVSKGLSQVLRRRLEDFDYIIELDNFKEFIHRLLTPHAAV
jgi:transcriptional regulator with XRE-family HTH domain